MSVIRLRVGPKMVVNVDVRASECPTLDCFWATTHTIRSAAGASGASSRSTDWWECGHREQRGCPEPPRTRRDPPAFRRQRGAWEETP
jgi:hypothetical protein